MAKSVRKTEHKIFDSKLVTEKELPKAGLEGYEVVGVADGAVIVSKMIGIKVVEIPVTEPDPDDDED